MEEEKKNQTLTNNVYAEKFKGLIEAKDFYNLLLEVKGLIGKEKRKNNYNEYCILVVFAVNELSKNNELNSCNDLFNIFLNDSDSVIKKKDKTSIKNFLDTAKTCFKSIPMLQNQKVKMSHIQKFQTLCDKNDIYDLHDLHERFAVDCIKADDPVSGYRFGLKSGNINLIQSIFNNSLEPYLQKNEKALALVRLSFELILLNNLKGAYRFLAQNIDVRNFKNNEPIMNFGFFLVFYLENNYGFVKFKELVYQYESSLKGDVTFLKYIDQISLSYFNKKVFPEQANFNILNMVQSLSRGGLN